MPKISVIVPVYKVEPYLHRCVDSILAQTFTDFELILVDDGSPDNCPAICDEYKEKDSRVVVIHQENGGLSAARNAGIDWAFANSDSEWITFIDSDDWIDSDYLRVLIEASEENSVDVAMCCFQKTDRNSYEQENKNVFLHSTSPEWIWRNNRVISTIACCKLYKKILFCDIRYPVGVIHEDEYTTFRILFKCETIVFVENKLYYYFVNPNSIMNQEWNLGSLHQVYAFREQIEFFWENGFKKAFKHSTCLYLNRILEAIEKLTGIPSYDKRLYKELIWSFRLGIWKYGIYGEYPPSKSTGRVYKCVFWFVFVRKKIQKKWSNFKELLVHPKE